MSVFMYMRNVESNIAQNEMNTRVKAIAKGGWKEGPVFSGRKEPFLGACGTGRAETQQASHRQQIILNTLSLAELLNFRRSMAQASLHRWSAEQTEKIESDRRAPRTSVDHFELCRQTVGNFNCLFGKAG